MLNPVVMLLVLVVGVLILVWPRNKALAAFIAASILIPMDQVLVVGGLHFPMLRLLILFGIVRLMREKISGRVRILSAGINKIDLSVLLLGICTAAAGTILFQQMAAFVFQLGNLYETLGIYFLLRFLIRDKADIRCMVQALAWSAVAVALVMSWEFATGQNPYALLGGARAASYGNIAVRDDRFRAMGSFGHPILAGTFGAIVMPLFPLLWREGKRHRTIAVVGFVSATLITITSNSSTPALAYAAGLIALCLWPLRQWIRALRWGIVITLVSLHLVMKAPVWHLISRIDVAGGSSGYHRYQLIDQCVRHFGDWWLLGVKSTADWGWDMWDTANQYVGTCEASGLLPFLLFLAIIVYGFKYLGKARSNTPSRDQQTFLWMLSAALFGNVVAFFGISYWDQTQVVWYGLLAAIGTTAGSGSELGRLHPQLARNSSNWSDVLTESAARAEAEPIARNRSLSSSGDIFSLCRFHVS